MKGSTAKARLALCSTMGFPFLAASLSLFGYMAAHAQDAPPSHNGYHHTYNKITQGLTLDTTQVMVTDLSAAGNGGLSDAMTAYLSGLQFNTAGMTNVYGNYWLVATPTSVQGTATATTRSSSGKRFAA